MAEQKMVTVAFDSEAVVDAVLEQIREVAEAQAGASVREKAREVAEAVVRKVIEEEARAFAKEHLQAAVSAAIAAGWKKTNNYGEPIGQTVTLEGFVRETLFKGDGYRGGLMQQVLQGQLEVALKGELGGILREATAKLRAMVDETVAAKLRGALNDAIKGAH